jgi:hypothetical protein
MMRTALVLGVLAGGVACGRSPRGDDDRGPGARAAVVQAAPDERCDPGRPRQCVGDDVVACEPDGTRGRRLRACRDGCDDGACVATCADDGAQLIYVVDDANELLSFDPRRLPGDPFQRIGTLACGRRLGEPFSMSVDRRGVAWVLYQNGELFKVSLADARCRPSRHVTGAAGFVRFGMGFVSDQPGGATEHLFIAADDASHALGAIDTTGDLTPRTLGTLTAATDHSPELTGTSDARLYGFYPGIGQPSFVQEIDRTTGAPRGPRWALGAAPLATVTAYAFAQWAGVFYVFVTTRDDSFAVRSTVHAIDRATGGYRVALDAVPYRVTGAGVSTCAPARGQ